MRKRKRTAKAMTRPVFTCTCRSCGEAFTITAGEKTWYDRRRLPLPTHCKICRKARKLLRFAARTEQTTLEGAKTDE